MKNLFRIISICCLISFTFPANAQIKGNGKIVTKIFPLEIFDFINIDITTDLYVDLEGKNTISITTDENLVDLVDRKIGGTSLTLDQKKWISPSSRMVIRVSASQLSGINCGAHSLVDIKNLNQESFQVVANVGTIILSGKVTSLQVENKVAKIDASKLIAAEANISISSWGSVTANVSELIESNIDKSGHLILVQKPKIYQGDAKELFQKNLNATLEVEWINFEIKNNSLARKHFYVVGPKKDGSRFSYGFPMMPGATRKENWTVGSKIYKVSKLGVRNLLVTIKAEDENQTVRLFR